MRDHAGTRQRALQRLAFLNNAESARSPRMGQTIAINGDRSIHFPDFDAFLPCLLSERP